jgi:Holliday junction DNA helicase RuvA
MIALVSGEVAVRRGDHVVVSCGGVGYRLNVSTETLGHVPRIGESATLFTHLVVREDAHLLFGFASENERRAFRQLIKITGVGARIALAVLSGLSVAELAQAVSMQDSGRLTKIPGIGKKTAERLLLELKDKLGADLTTAVGVYRPAPVAADVLNALLSLGYSDKEAARAVKELPEGIAVGDGIRQALKLLAKA